MVNDARAGGASRFLVSENFSPGRIISLTNLTRKDNGTLCAGVLFEIRCECECRASAPASL